MQKITIVGAGNFGFALMAHLDRKQDPNWQLCLYARNQQLVEQLNATRVHPDYYPTTELSGRVQITSELQAALEDCQVLVLAVASTGVRDILRQLQESAIVPPTIVSIIKALDQTTGQPITQVIEAELASAAPTLAALAGGTTGEGLVSEQYLGATLACPDATASQRLAAIFQSPYLRIQTSRDLLGVQYAGSLKNLISVIVGILSGLGFAYGTQTHALSLAASECERWAVAHGAQAETFDFASQCWGNDMVMSATDPHTRNHRLGLALGQGVKYTAAVEQMHAAHQTAESANTLQVWSTLQIDLAAYPLLNFLLALSQERVGAHQLVKLIETY